MKTPVPIGDGLDTSASRGFLLVEAARAAVRCDPEWRRKFVHRAMRRDRRVAKVAMARKLAVSLFWMWRKEWNYEQVATEVRRLA